MKQEIKERIELINKGMVPAGYKKTPVGICPVEWEENIYRNLGEFAKGKGIPGYALLDNGLPCVGYGDIYTKYNIKFNAAKCFTDEITAKDSKKISKNTLLFTGSGETVEEIGKCVCYCGDEDISAGGDIILFNSYNVNPLFLSYQQNFWPFIKEKARLGQGHSVVHIYPDDISKLHAIFPKTKPEQEKIAEILNCATRQVELQEQIVDKLKVQKKALMQKLLTPQPDWQEDKLEKLINEGLITLYRGKVISKEDIKKFPGNYPIYSSSVINNGEMGEYGKYMFDEELITWSIDGGGNFFYRNKHKFSVTNVCGYIKINTNYFNYKFLAEELIYLHSKLSFDYMLKAHPSVIKKIYTINYPNLKEQTKIAKLALNLDKQIELQQKLLEQYKLRQKALMQLLLTGIVRVCK